MKKLLLVLTLLLIASNYSRANNVSEESISLYADFCEKLEQDETTSRARSRASDKAVFLAVEKLHVLELPRKEFDQYDFNILVYKLIDNYIEDLNVRTIRQDAQKICVEIDGYIKGSNLISSVAETKKLADKRAARRANENLSGNSAFQTQKEIENIIMKEADIKPVEDTVSNKPNGAQGQVIRFPDKEDTLVKTEQKTQSIIEEPINDITLDDIPTGASQKVIIQDSDTIIIVNEEEEKINTSEIKEVIKEQAKVIEQPKALVYIAATKFFDETSSQKHSDILRELFANNEYFNLTDNKEKADYIVNPNILRVKIDAINNITNRMQMVAMVEMEDVRENSNIKEHQNRFTLLSAEDNEQEIAQNLMNKLLEKAGSQILSKIETTERKRNNIRSLPKIITPGSSSSTLQDVLLSL